MTKYVAICKGDSGKNERFIIIAYDYADFLSRLNDELNAIFYQWEIVKIWKLN